MKQRQKIDNKRKKKKSILNNTAFHSFVILVLVITCLDIMYVVVDLADIQFENIFGKSENVITDEIPEDVTEGVIEDVTEDVIEGVIEDVVEDFGVDLEDSIFDDMGDSVNEANTSTIYYYYNQLDVESQEIYDTILGAIEMQASEVIIESTDIASCADIISRIFYDHSELFWWDSSYKYSLFENEITYKFTYTYDEEEVIIRKEQIEEEIEEILSSASKVDTDYEKVKMIYEYLIDSVSYVEDSADNQNIYSSLVNKESICAGYARATQYLLNCLDIQCLYISGETTDEEGVETHGWNIVKCEDLYYQLDTTFGEGESIEEDYDIDGVGINYSYLCCSDEIIYIAREVTMDFDIPECNSNDLNYYSMQGCFYEEYSSDIIDDFEDSLRNNEDFWSLQLADESIYNQVVDDMDGDKYMDIVGEYFTEIGYIGSYTFVFVSDDSSFAIKCWASES